MASQPEASELSSTFERLIRSRDISLFLPFIFGFSNALHRRGSPQNDDIERENDNNRVILINPFTQGMVVIEGASGLDSLLRELGGKGGPPPAARSAIEALPRVEISDDFGEECVICLDEFCSGGFAKEMPCKHRFHEDCIEKWLGIHGSCPVCRHKMPADESENKKRGFEREIWVSFSLSSGTRTDDERASSGDEAQG